MKTLEATISRIMNEAKLNRCGKNIINQLTNSICPICKNTGWETVTNDGKEFCIECRCGIQERKKMSSRLKFAEIPESFQNTRIKDFDLSVYRSRESKKKIETAWKVINYWLHHFESMQEEGMGLYLHSKEKGSGKTRMAVSIANELIYEKKIQVKFATSLQILNEIKSTWDKNDSSISESKLLDFLSTTRVLIVDDFGMEKHKDWIDDKFNGIINYRYNTKKITIFTSNESLEMLKYDDRIKNRILERTFQIPFPEESIREVIAKQNMMELINKMRLEG